MPLKSPLQIFADWLAVVSADVRDHIALTTLTKIGLWDPLGNSRQEYLQWLCEPLDGQQHVGRAIVVCAFTDYLMEENGHPHYWERVENNHLEIVEADVSPEARQIMNLSLGELANRKKAWLGAAEEWWKLRAAELHNSALREWEMAALGL